ncbi:MAG: bifunctional (p)ppGpp synthetase/guanosine-3',5'-bis(diphosphate) 3'-pyrophosphohydrolase [Clostridia bacterium]|nr:bifunctional (p)ppGpp synthetase/guanosine-3',5'-bis(diphosphate) 3'-pyrophosphohydrolase [Clostridia bacterium]
MDEVIERFKSKYRLVYDDSQAELLDRILTYSEKKHRGQFRQNGEPYIHHPVEVGNILLELGLDVSAVGAALLHDTVEDTDATEGDIYSLFGQEIAELVMGVTKLAKFTFKSKEDEQAENFRRMYFAMAKDIRVILIKLADRLHNMRTIASKRRERQIAIATETLEIYSPLASRLGLSYIKCELEDLCFQVLKPEEYEKLVREIPLKRAERQGLVNLLCARLNNIIKELGITGEVSGRPKHYYSIYKKMDKQKKTFEQIYDLTAVRVIVSTIKDCYEVLGMIHTLWKPMPGRFKDYISVPKQNNYQSLHTTVMTSFGMPFEIQIRTYEMHKIAEYGIAAHWLYKENNRAADAMDRKLEWLRDVMDVQNDSVSPQEFYESLKVDLYSGMVYVFTPKGDVVALPEGSTPIDFAYGVHTEVGNTCIGAKIDNKEVPLETKLATGDYVEILTSPNSKGPSRDWLRIVQSTQAKAKIKAFFKKEIKDENIEKGKKMLADAATEYGYDLDELMDKRWVEVIMKRYTLSSVDDLYASVGYGGYKVEQILPKLIDFYRKEEKLKAENQDKNGGTSDIIVNGYDDQIIRMARCCNPVPGDEIVGYISHGKGIAIHRKGCNNIRHIDQDMLLEAHWRGHTSSQFVIALQIETLNTAGLLAEITKYVSDFKLSIVHLNARVDKRNHGIINISISANNMEEIESLKEKIASIKDVDRVYRY